MPCAAYVTLGCGLSVKRESALRVVVANERDWNRTEFLQFRSTFVKRAPYCVRLEPEPQKLPRIVSYNVRHCRGRDGVVSPSRIAEVIAVCEPDIVALQELDVGRLRSARVDQAVAIAEELKMMVHFHPAFKVMEELYGDAILTALPSKLVKAGPLPGLKRRPRLEPRGALWTEVSIAGTALQVINTHLGLLASERAAQVGALLGADWLAAAMRQGPVLLAADLNAPPWGRSYRRLAAALHGHKPQQRTISVPATFPSCLPLLRIDHVIASPSVRIKAMTAPRSRLAKEASDHLPLVVDFEILASHLPSARREMHDASDRY